MTDNPMVVICLPTEACSLLVGSLWAIAAGSTGEERGDLVALAARIHLELCRKLQIDPLLARDLLIGLPRELRVPFGDQVARQVHLRGRS